MSKSAPRLGRGLASLLPSVNTAPAKPLGAPSAPPEPSAAATVREIPLAQIRPNPRQPRTAFDQGRLEELAASIRQSGVLQPVMVRSAANGSFELIAGERRFRAATLAGLATVPAIVREVTEAESLELALVENLQREDLGPLERAHAYQRYLDTFGGSIEDLAARVGESRANVSNYLRLLKLHPEICFMLGSGELSMGHARALVTLPDPQRQLTLARLAARKGLSVRQVEQLAKQGGAPTPDAAEQPKRLPDKHLDDVAGSLSRNLGLRVRLQASRKKNAGKVVIFYQSLEEFERLTERLGGVSFDA